MSRRSVTAARAGAHRALVAALLASAAAGCAAPEGPPRVGSPLPELVTSTLAGDTVLLSSLAGQPVLLNLWATWCHPCRRETPYLQSLHEAHVEDGLRVVGVTVDTRGSLAAIHAFVEEMGVTYTILHDPDMVSMDRFAVFGLPATYLVDRGGTIRWMASGPVGEGDAAFEAAIREILE